MKRNLPIGTSDFKKIRNQNSYYVDKSLMIKEIIDDCSEIILIPRPRRFGKTLNMSMLRYFFDLNDAEANRKLFDGLNITKEVEFDNEQGRYPVIFLTFKDIKETSFEASFEKLQEVIADEYGRFSFLLESDEMSEVEKEQFDDIIKSRTSVTRLQSSLKKLTKYLFNHFKQKPILLIDEYDTPIHAAYTEGYYKKMIDFMRAMLGDALKDNSNLHKGVLTGTLRISKESIFTGLNNPSVYTLLSHRFNDKFGFTQNEVSQMLVDYDLESETESVKAWYNGYIIGKIDIYNPWSIINFIHNKDEGFKPHWVNSSSNDLIKDIIKDSPASVHAEMLELLDNKILVKSLDENISFPELKSTDNSIYSFLVFSGYLKARFLEHTDDNDFYQLMIPNLEVKRLFKNIFLTWFKETFSNGKNVDLINALLSKDTNLFGEILGECVLHTLSVHDVERREVERVYQAFLLGILVSLTPDYEVTSNKESGYGRYDICIVPLKNKTAPSIILELKSIRISETAETALVSALKQIEDKQYEASIRQRGYEDILKLAVVFDGKRVWVKS